MSSIVCGRGPFARLSVCPKAKRKTMLAIALIYLGAAAIASAAFNAARTTHVSPVQKTVGVH